MNRYVWMRLISSMRGKKLIKKLTEGNRIDDLLKTAIISFPEKDISINKYGVMFVDEYLMRNKLEQAILIYIQDDVYNLANNYVRSKVLTYKVAQKDMEDILAFYSLFSFSKQFKVISLDLPFCRNGRKLLSHPGIDEEMLVGVGIYGIIPFRRLGGNV